MWFRNLFLYRIEFWPQQSPEQLADALETQRINDCGRLEPLSTGWTSPLGRQHEVLTHAANGCILLRYAKQEKVIPAAVVREAVAQRGEELANKRGQPTVGKERVRLRDEVIMELLPQAFVKPSHTDLYLDPKSGWLVIDTASAKSADEIVALLRKSVDGLKLSVLDVSNRVKTLMTDWLAKASLPNTLSFGDECDLRDERDAGSVVRCRKQDLTSDEIQPHIEAGKKVIRLGLYWQERLSFVFSEDFVILKLKPQDLLITQMQDIQGEDALATLDGEFALLNLEVASLLKDLQEIFELP